MRLEGTFLRSRAGRRIFWTLLLAAAAPIALFGVAMHAMLSSQFETQAARQQAQLTKFAGMGLLDRSLDELEQKLANARENGTCLISMGWGGGLLAKPLYDRREGKRAAKAEGKRAVEAQAKRGDEEGSDT